MQVNLAKDVFIWTEAFNCGEILDPMLKSYLAHNEFELNIFGTSKDFNHVTVKSPLLKFHDLSMDKKTSKIEARILNKYQYGHKGTAELWKYLIIKRSERYFIHLDSDTIFLADAITDLIESVKLKGYSLAGSRRPYLHRPYRKLGIDGIKLDKLPDVVATDCFIFDKKLIQKRPYWYLNRKIVGRRPLKHPVVDFFDPVSFEIITKGGLVLYMDSPNDGTSSVTNFDSDFMQKRISFAAVGSGLNFYKNPNVETSPGYKNFALSSYSLFAKWLLNKDIGILPLDAPEIVSKLEKLNQTTWSIR
jgi:hypothetical protein